MKAKRELYIPSIFDVEMHLTDIGQFCLRQDYFFRGKQKYHFLNRHQFLVQHFIIRDQGPLPIPPHNAG